MPKAIIFDIDGTLANCDHRLHFLTDNGQKNFDAFYGALSADTPYQDILDLFLIVNNDDSHDPIRVVLCSGRPENYREATQAWIIQHLGCVSLPLYMRPAGDFRRDDIIKEELLTRIRADGYDPILAIDDRKRVVDMWRRNGITCLQCREWSEADPRRSTDEASKLRGLLTLMVGPVCGGKTTMAKSLAATVSNCQYRVSSDSLREEFTGTITSQDLNNQVFRAAHAMIAARIQNGLHCVFDATNLKRKDRLTVVALAKGGPVRYIVCDRPLPEKVEAAHARMAVYPCKTDWSAIVLKHHERMGSCIRDILKGDTLPNVTVTDARATS